MPVTFISYPRLTKPFLGGTSQMLKCCSKFLCTSTIFSSLRTFLHNKHPLCCSARCHIHCQCHKNKFPVLPYASVSTWEQMTLQTIKTVTPLVKTLHKNYAHGNLLLQIIYKEYFTSEKWFSAAIQKLLQLALSHTVAQLLRGKVHN
jgi:hypothetical protein